MLRWTFRTTMDFGGFDLTGLAIAGDNGSVGGAGDDWLDVIYDPPQTAGATWNVHGSAVLLVTTPPSTWNDQTGTVGA